MIKYEHKIGSTVGTGVEKEVQNNFNGETQEVGMYLAMSRQASRSVTENQLKYSKDQLGKKQNTQQDSVK